MAWFNEMVHELKATCVLPPLMRMPPPYNTDNKTMLRLLPRLTIKA